MAVLRSANFDSARIFLLGPSHHKYLDGCALSRHQFYTTPLGVLPIDRDTVGQLRATGEFELMSTSTDAKEHSLELHLPYIHRVLSRQNVSASLVPILVGSISSEAEQRYGRLLAPYLADPSSVFVISSDFCHWGSRFRYTYYLPSPACDLVSGINLRDARHIKQSIYESIERIDQAAMQSISAGSHAGFVENLETSGNTVCGRHPIGVAMAALEQISSAKFHFVKYERSNDIESPDDSSVSYASAYAVI